MDVPLYIFENILQVMNVPLNAIYTLLYAMYALL